MRPIGEFDDEERASTFSGYLNYKGISCEVEEDDEGKSWTVWAHNEETLAKAIAEIHEFRQKPDASKYAALAREALKQEKKERKNGYRSRPLAPSGSFSECYFWSFEVLELKKTSWLFVK